MIRIFRLRHTIMFFNILIAVNIYGQVADKWYPGLPIPKGKFGIGCTTENWIDSGRIEPLSHDHSYREIQVEIWYPSDKRKGPTASYIDFEAFDKYKDSTELNLLVGNYTAEIIREG